MTEWTSIQDKELTVAFKKHRDNFRQIKKDMGGSRTVGELRERAQALNLTAAETPVSSRKKAVKPIIEKINNQAFTPKPRAAKEAVAPAQVKLKKSAYEDLDKAAEKFKEPKKQEKKTRPAARPVALKENPTPAQFVKQEIAIGISPARQAAIKAKKVSTLKVSFAPIEPVKRSKKRLEISPEKQRSSKRLKSSAVEEEQQLWSDLTIEASDTEKHDIPEEYTGFLSSVFYKIGRKLGLVQ